MFGTTVQNKDEQMITMQKRKISSEHIKSYRKNDRKCTQAELSELLGFDFQAIGRYERMECSVSIRAAMALSKMSGWIEAYWLGETECKTEEEYDEWCANAALEMQANEIREAEHRIDRISKLLNTCGFGYEYLSGGPQYDFIDFSNDTALKLEVNNAQKNNTPHKITDYSKKHFPTPAYLSDNELNNMISDIRKLIGFCCYKKTIE